MSFILQANTGRQVVAYRHVILLTLSLTFPKNFPRKSPKIAVVDNLIRLLFPETRIIGLHFCRR